jgi:hypothetical protein
MILFAILQIKNPQIVGFVSLLGFSTAIGSLIYACYMLRLIYIDEMKDFFPLIPEEYQKDF